MNFGVTGPTFVSYAKSVDVSAKSPAFQSEDQNGFSPSGTEKSGIRDGRQDAGLSVGMSASQLTERKEDIAATCGNIGNVFASGRQQ